MLVYAVCTVQPSGIIPFSFQVASLFLTKVPALDTPLSQQLTVVVIFV